MKDESVKAVKWDDFHGSPASTKQIEELEKWNQISKEMEQRETIEPLPITEEEYQILMPLLASYGLGQIMEEERQVLTSILEKIELENCNSIPEIYFEIQRKARMANRFSDVEIGEVEEILFNMRELPDTENSKNNSK